MRWGVQVRRGRILALAALGLGVLAVAQSAAAPRARGFSRSRPVSWISVAPGQQERVWVETAAGGSLSDDGGRSFRAPLATGAFQRAQVAQATLLADGKTLVAMPTVWSAQQFTAPRWSADGGATWRAGALRGADAHYDFGAAPGFAGESPVTADPTDPRTAWFCQGNLYVTHDAGRTWAVATPRLKRPWHCAALAIASGRQHTLILLVQSKARSSERVPGRLLRSVDAGATWTQLKAPRYPQLDSNGHALAFDPARPSTLLMIGASGATPGRLYRSLDAGVSWKRVRPAGSLRGAVVDEFAFASDGRALALVRTGDRQQGIYASADGGGHWVPAPALQPVGKAAAVIASPLAASGTSFLLGTNRRGFWRLAPGGRRWSAP
jgi:photosystem II stability/assembly factor-like uncharacterized protein